jgi:hypothetical protein
MAFKSKPSKIGLNDPSVERTVQGTLTQQSIIANASPTIEGNKVVLPNSTVRTTATTVGVLTSANNEPGDTVTVYSGANNIYVSAIDQTVQSFNLNGVTQIVPGTNISVSPGDGTGIVTISASSSLNATKIQNGTSYANIEDTNGNLIISANGRLWTFNTDGNIVLPISNSSINYPNGTPYGGSGNGFSNGTSNGSIPAANGNINFSVNGNANILVVTDTGANIDGTLAVTGESNLNAVGNVTITGGTAGQYLETDGAGNLSWSTVTVSGFSNGYSSGSIPLANGNINFSVDGVPNIVVITDTGANITGTLAVTGESNLNAVGNVTITGGTAGQYLQTDGAGNLSWSTVSGSGFSNGTSNGSIPAANGNINFSVNGNSNILVVTGTGANITGTANVAGNLSVTGKSNLNAVGNVIITGGTTGQYLQTDGAGNLSWSTVSTSVTGFSNGTSNGSIPTANGNVNFSVNGNANILVVTGTGANITGTANVDGNLSVTGTSNLNAVGNVIITGGTTGQYLQTDGTGNLSWSSVTTSVSGFSNGTSTGSIPTADGNINFTVNGNSNIVVITGTGANITGTANVAGNLSVTGKSNLNAVGNVIITGGTTGQYLKTDGAGNLSWASVNTASISNGTSGINIPVANGNVVISSGTNSNALVITSTGANIDRDLDVLGNGNIGGNLEVGGEITANGNIQGNYILGNGSQLTGISSISNGTSNIRIALNSNIALSVAGNANVFTFTGNSANFSKSVVLASNLTVAGNTLFGSNVSMNAFNITNLAEPNVGSDAATKYYVDTFASGLTVKQSANAGTTSNLDVITGGTASYNNGTSGVGANITITGGTLTNIDGVPLTANMRLLIKNEANQAWNGVYVYNNTTVITRATDFDTDAEVLSGAFLFITTGSALADTAWVQTTDTVVVGTSNIVFSQFSGAGSFQANQGVNLTGVTFSANTDGVTTGIISGNIVVIPSAQLTTPNIGAATGSSLNLTGDATVGNVSAANATFSGNVIANNLQVLGQTDLNSISNITITGGTAGQVITTDGTGNLSFSDSGVTPGSLTRYFTASSTVVAPTTLDTFSSDDYRSVLYQIQISSGSDYEATIISLLQNDTNVFISQFSDVTSNIPLASFDASLAANVVTVTFTPVNGVTAVSGIATYLAV